MSKVNVIEKNGLVIFDLDGCVFLDEWRRHLIKGEDYTKYHQMLHRDLVNSVGKKHLDDAIKNNLYVLFVTARPVEFIEPSVKKITKEFAIEPGQDFTIYMRPTADLRGSVDLKREIVSSIIEMSKEKKINLVGAFDDREDVIAMYKELGLVAFVLDENGCDAPLLQSFKPDPMAKFTQPLPVAGAVPPNEHSAKGKPESDGPTIADDVADAVLIADGPTQPSAAPGLPGVPEFFWPFANLGCATPLDTAVSRVAGVLFPEGLKVPYRDRSVWRAFSEVLTELVKVSVDKCQDDLNAEELVYKAEVLASQIRGSVARLPQ